MRIKTLTDIPAIADYFRRIGAEPRSFRTGVIKEIKGKYWIDIAVIKIDEDGTIVAPPPFEPTPVEIASIEAACKGVTWPHIKKLYRLFNVPEELSKTDPRNLYEFKDDQGQIVMVQQRVELKDGSGKIYVPWTYWDDDEWRKMEPEGPLPLWGLDQLSNNSVVFIHEGAKPARYITGMIAQRTPEWKERLASHPWAEELRDAAHVGWIGGALSPGRTDWRVLNAAGITKAYIVSDNDAQGKSSVASISRQLRIPTFHIQFTEEWPQGYDLADSFPRHMFHNIDGVDYYTGPSFRKCMHPATWATDLIPNPRGKPTPILREHFKSQWSYVETIDQFICLDMPEIVRPEPVTNKLLSKFSDAYETTKLIVRSAMDRTVGLCYMPGDSGRITTDASTTAINTHIPTDVKPKEGNIAPFLEFMEYLIPIEHERKEVLRWCATLIAKLEVHMEFGLLLASETQGIGKTTLGAHILAPLVGAGGQVNVSYPTEAQIQGDFNGWAAQKRLCIFNEIYAGHSWKVYNKLKSLITDTKIDVNEKYQRAYTLDNYAHIFACSNSLEALKIEKDDRRWYFPKVTEDKWPPAKFKAFYKWIKCGGLSIILTWARGYGDYISAGEPPKMTERKAITIITSRSEGQQEAFELAEHINTLDEPTFLLVKEVEETIKEKIKGRFFDSGLSLRKSMKEAGVYTWEDRVIVNRRPHYVLFNAAAYEELRSEFKLISTKKIVAAPPDDMPAIREKIRKMVRNPRELFDKSM